MDEKLLTLDDLADYLNVSRRTTYRLLKGGDLPAYRIGSHLRFRREDIDGWLEKQKLEQKKNGITPPPGSPGGLSGNLLWNEPLFLILAVEGFVFCDNLGLVVQCF